MLSFILSVFFGLLSILGESKDVLGVPGPIEFNKTKFELAKSFSPIDSYYMQSYLPKGEDAETFNQKINILMIEEDTDLEKVIASKMKDLKERKKWDWNSSFVRHDTKKDGVFILEYTTCEYDDKKIFLAEFNLSKVQEIKLPDGRTVVMITTYVWRSYDNETAQFLTNLKNFKEEFIIELENLSFSNISLNR